MKRNCRPDCAALRRVAVAAAACVAGANALAIEFDTGNPDLSVRWDNTIKYSAAARLREQDPALLRPNVCPRSISRPTRWPATACAKQPTGRTPA